MDIKEIISNGKEAIGGITDLVKKIIPEGAMRDAMVEGISMDPKTIAFLESCKNIELDKRDQDSSDPFNNRWHAALGWTAIVATNFYFIVYFIVGAVVAIKHNQVLPPYDSFSLLGFVAMLLGYKGVQAGAQAVGGIVNTVVNGPKKE